MTDESHAATVTLGDARQGSHPACYSRLGARKSGCPHAGAADEAGVHYSRLFKGGFTEASEIALRELAKAMQGEGGRDDAKGTPSGVVYLGQFIAHDITRDGTALSKMPFPTPETTRNERTPRLDLDSVYGTGPVGDAVEPGGDYQIYSQPRPGEEIFRLGPTEPAVVNGISFPSTDVDFPRRSDDRSPIIPDDRNDDNLILAQLHGLFLRFHNKLLNLIVAGSVNPVPDGPTPFEQTRRLVTWHYQRLVREYFLPMVVLQSVLDDIKANGPKLFKPESAKDLSLPVEFTMAAFRFGHSMVHETYFINEMHSLSANDILNREDRPLRADLVLDWSRFVGSGRTVNLAQKINTTISTALFGLPNETISPYRNNAGLPTEASLPTRSLLRGSKARLPSGQEACVMAETRLIEVDASHRHYAVLKDNGLLDRLPLWYYILHEAEVAGIDESLSVPSQEGGCRLGPLGSRIVAEVLLGLLRLDEDIYPDGWEPPELPFPNGHSKRIMRLGALAEFVS
jgi:hypothetical protein